MSFVCVQPAVSSYARKTEDLTSDKTDDKDAVLIARLTAQLRCYLPEPVDPTWGRLRHLGARREQLLESHTRCVQQIRDLLECVWPAALEAAAQPFKSTTWVAALTRGRGPRRREPGPHPPARAGPVHPAGARRGGPSREGSSRACGSSGRSSRPSPLPLASSSTARPRSERIGWILTDWERARTDQVVVEARMVAVLGQLELDRSSLLSSTGCPRSVPRRSWPRPVTCAGSPPPVPWSSWPASLRGNGCPAPSPARPACPAPDARGCG